MDLDSKKINFLLADDHSIIRQGIEFLIEELDFEGEIFHAPTLKKVLETLDHHSIDIIIIDALFPDGNSLNIIPEILAKKPGVKILVFSGVNENTQSIKYIQAGANGFLTKQSEEEEIKNAIQKIHQEGSYLSSIAQSLLLSSMNGKNIVNPLSSLTDREIQIAELYAKGLGNLEIAAYLDIKQNTVSTIKKRIFDKLGIENLVELIELMNPNH